MPHTVKAVQRVSTAIFLILLSATSCNNPENEKKTIRKITRHLVYELSDTLQPHAVEVSPDTSYLEHIFSRYDLINVRDIDSTIQVELRYASRNNILGNDFYDGLRNAYVVCPLAIRLANAQWFLKQADSTLSLLILDAARPHHIQQMMWDSINIHEDIKTRYLAHPEATSLHNYGCAVDLTILDLKTGKPIDMGSDYDFFGRISRTDSEAEFLKNGLLNENAINNRRLLRRVMTRAGLRGISSEWWHFSLCKRHEAAQKFKLIE